MAIRVLNYKWEVNKLYILRYINKDKSYLYGSKQSKNICTGIRRVGVLSTKMREDWIRCLRQNAKREFECAYTLMHQKPIRQNCKSMHPKKTAEMAMKKIGLPLKDIVRSAAWWTLPSLL